MEHDSRKSGGQTMALNTGRVPKQKLNIDFGGGQFYCTGKKGAINHHIMAIH